MLATLEERVESELPFEIDELKELGRRTTKFSELSDKNLKRLQITINDYNITVTEAAKIFKISRTTLRERLKQRGYPLKVLDSGRRPKDISDETKNLIVQYKTEFNYGINKTRQKLVFDAEKAVENGSEVPFIPSFHMCRKVFKEEKLFKFTRTNKKVGKSRYEACSSNLIWHVDIHYINGKQSKPFYGIIDDYSRAILGYKTLKNAKAKSVLKILVETINEKGKPYCLWSDNGPETKAEFHDYLIKNDIKHVTTKPHSPQQNGKIEKFWIAFESFLEKKKNIDEIITIYNNSPHESLPIKTVIINGQSYKRHMSPMEIYSDEEHKWFPGKPPIWNVDGKQLEFLPESVNDSSESSE